MKINIVGECGDEFKNIAFTVTRKIIAYTNSTINYTGRRKIKGIIFDGDFVYCCS